MGGGKKTQETVAKSETGPPAWLTPYFKDLAARAYDAAGQVQTSYNNELIAKPNQTQMDALMQALGVAESATASGTGQTLIDNAAATARGDYLNNPQVLTDAITAALAPANEQFFRETLPGIRDLTIGRGAYGGDRHGIVEGVAAGDLGAAQSQIAAALGYDNYTRERANQVNAADQYASAIQAALAPAGITETVGNTLQGFEQAELDELLALFNMNQSLPFAGLNEMASLLNAGGYQSSSGTQTSTVTQPKGLGGVVQSVLGVGSLAKGLGGGKGSSTSAAPLSAMAGLAA